jgi:dolichol kinase
MINYSWDESDTSIDENIKDKARELSSRNNIQILRRLFHMFTGFSIASLYLVSFSHSQMIHFLGTIAALLYVVEQVRISYPETPSKLLPFTKFVMRAEEQLKESAMMPYAMAVLLTIVAFPKHIALIGVYSLAFADPLSAIFGIKYGKHKITANRSIEGSLAFFISIFIVTLFILGGYNQSIDFGVFIIAFAMGTLGAGFDLIPLKLDDNLTIPLFTASALWLILTLFGVYI